MVMSEMDRLGFDHPTGFMFFASSGAEDGIDLVDEHDTRLKFPSEREDGADKLIRIAVPFLRQGGDVEVDEAGPALVRQRFGEHGLAASGRAVQQDTRWSGE